MAIQHEISSGNIFNDINMPEPNTAMAKAELARRISNLINDRHLNQTNAAKLLRIDQPKISRLVRGQLKDFSIERLMHFLMKLDQDIEIIITQRPQKQAESRILIA